MGFADDKGNGVNRSQHIAHMSHTHQLRALREQLVEQV